MEFMKKAILTACILCVIITIADCLKPCERFTKQLRTIFALVFITGVIGAVVSTGADFEMPDFEGEDFSDSCDSISDTVNEKIEEQTGERISAIAGDILRNKGISYDKISCDVNILQNGSIDISRICYSGDNFIRAARALEESFPDTEVEKIE